jgi:hypothetical protein
MDELTQFIRETVDDHLRSRGMDSAKTYVVVDEASNVATFLLFNLTGQLVGYQQYRPDADKKVGNDPSLARYFTYVGSEGKGKKLAVWGLETVEWTDDYLFVVEGIFDAVKVHNAGHPCIAVLCNDPRPMKAWFKAMGKHVIAVLDRDAAGNKLRNIANANVVVPEPYKDLGDMPQEEATRFIDHALTNT